MKKILGLMLGIIMLFSTTTFAASEPQISFTVDGKATKGEKITINIMAKDVSRLYALSADYTYNPEFLKVNSITGGKLIKDSDLNAMELGGQTDIGGNRANYQMTFTGRVDGVSGEGQIVIIEAEVLKDFELRITKDNMKIKLVKIDKDYEVSEMSYNFNSLNEEVKPDGGEKPGEGDKPGTGDGNTDKPGTGDGNGGDTNTGDGNSNGGETTNPEPEKKPSLIDKVVDKIKDTVSSIFKKPETTNDSNESSSNNGSASGDNTDKNTSEEKKDDTDTTKTEGGESTENSDNKTDETSEEVSGNKNILVGALVGLVVIIGVTGAAVAIVRKKKNKGF